MSLLIYELDYCPNKSYSGTLTALEDDYIEIIEQAGIKGCVYWYTQGYYEGSGFALFYFQKLWFLNDLGHCSCYGPIERGSVIQALKSTAYKSLEELLNACSAGLQLDIKPLVQLAKNKLPQYCYKEEEKEVKGKTRKLMISWASSSDGVEQ